jgi:5-methylcytosine-specific restriction endonuclease McrA
MNIKHGKWSKKPCKFCGTITDNVSFCKRKCQIDFIQNEIYTKIDNGEYQVEPFSGNHVVKNYLILRRGCKCENCNLDKWMDADMPLTVHHVDGNASNNNPSNIELLCWNCHALTENYGNKNKKSARIKRY